MKPLKRFPPAMPAFALCFQAAAWLNLPGPQTHQLDSIADGYRRLRRVAAKPLSAGACRERAVDRHVGCEGNSVLGAKLLTYLLNDHGAREVDLRQSQVSRILSAGR